MPRTPFPLWAVARRLDNGLWLADALFCPEFSRLADLPRALGKGLVRAASRTLDGLPPADLYRRRLEQRPDVQLVELELEPPKELPGWREPWPVRFPALVWDHGEEAVLAFIPDLQIDVIAPKRDDLPTLLEAEVRAALHRSGAGHSLEKLAFLSRTAKLVVRPLTARPRLLSPKKRLQAAERKEEAQKRSPLVEAATRLDGAILDPAYEVEPIVAQLAEALGGKPPQSVLLVGPPGVGKTAAFRELVRQREARGLGRSTFWQTSGARLVAGQSGFGAWQERCRAIVRDATKKQAILHLGSLVELTEVGKSEHQHAGIASFLRPYLGRGELLAVAECTPEQLPLLERDDPHLLDGFRVLRMNEPDAAAVRRVLAAAAPPTPPLAPAALDELDRLHRRYATGSASPGRPLRFLKNLLRDCAGSPAVTAAQVRDAFGRETGLPRVLLDPAVPLDLGPTRDWFTGRVLGQPEAVDLVVDLLATVKAGLSRPGRPIASLLFIGPTGVGKTELAKALAEFLFGSRTRLTRFDLSEFADPLSVRRLAGGVFGTEGLLTAAVREQPFSVLLLDEFEKAHPSLFDLLLQVLGEGRLTDAAGRTADFRNAVVILTSNLGAESYRPEGFGLAPTSAGDDERRRAQEHFLKEVQDFVRPEFFNRLDRVVPFAPLQADTIRQIAELALLKVRERDGIKYRGVALDVAAGVAAHLGKNGFDIRYGARPLQRAVERELLAPLADQLNRYESAVPLAATVDLSPAGTLRVEAKPRTDDSGRVLAAGGQELFRSQLANSAGDLRRELQALDRCGAVTVLRNELFELQRWEEARQKLVLKYTRLADELAAKNLGHAAARLRKKIPFDPQRIAKLELLGALDLSIRAARLNAEATEDEALLGLYGQARFADAEINAAVAGLRDDSDRLLLEVYCLNFPQSRRVTLGLYAEQSAWLFDLAGHYAAAAKLLGDAVQAVQYRLPEEVEERAAAQLIAVPRTLDDLGEPRWELSFLVQGVAVGEPVHCLLVREVWLDVPRLLQKRPKGTLGLALEFTGVAALPRWSGEGGLHVTLEPKNPGKCLVETHDGAAAAYVPPSGVGRRGFIGPQPRRRGYEVNQEYLEDAHAGRVSWQRRGLPAALAELLGAQLRRNVRALLA